MAKKKVIIIEDDYNDFCAIKNHLHTSFECYPIIRETEDFDRFKSLLVTSLTGNSCLKDEARQEIIESFINIEDPSCFIVDYQLRMENKELINGINFYRQFALSNDESCIKLPVLFLSGISSKETRNQISRFCKSTERNYQIKCDFIEKQKYWKTKEGFSDTLINAINDITYKPEPEGKGKGKGKVKTDPV